MTITYYNAEFTGGGEASYHGSISARKETPGRLEARISLLVGGGMTQGSAWGVYCLAERPGALSGMVDRLKNAARDLGMQMKTEGFTEFANRLLNLPDTKASPVEANPMPPAPAAKLKEAISSTPTRRI